MDTYAERDAFKNEFTRICYSFSFQFNVYQQINISIGDSNRYALSL